MKRCKTIKKLMPCYILNDGISLGAKEEVLDHIKNCETCFKELTELKTLFNGTNDLKKEINEEIESIDWEKNVSRISSRLKEEQNKIFSLPVGTGKGWGRNIVLKAAATFVMGIILGYLLFHSKEIKQKDFTLIKPLPKKSSYLQAVHTYERKEIESYLIQIRFFIVSLVGESRLNSNLKVDLENVKYLLRKNRFFINNPDSIEYLSVREILKDLNFIFYEIISHNGKLNSVNLAPLQSLIRDKRLLLKINLILGGFSNNYKEV